MPHVICDKCEGTGRLEVEEEKMSLADLLIPFISENTIGFKLRPGAHIPKLGTLEEQEQFGKVVEALHTQGQQ